MRTYAGTGTAYKPLLAADVIMWMPHKTTSDAGDSASMICPAGAPEHKRDRRMLSWDNWTGDIAALEDPEPEPVDDVETGSGLSSSEERCASREGVAKQPREAETMYGGMMSSVYCLCGGYSSKKSSCNAQPLPMTACLGHDGGRSNIEQVRRVGESGV